MKSPAPTNRPTRRHLQPPTGATPSATTDTPPTAQRSGQTTRRPPKSVTCSLSNFRHHFFQFPRPNHPKSVTYSLSNFRDLSIQFPTPKIPKSVSAPPPTHPQPMQPQPRPDRGRVVPPTPQLRPPLQLSKALAWRRHCTTTRMIWS